MVAWGALLWAMTAATRHDSPHFSPRRRWRALETLFLIGVLSLIPSVEICPAGDARIITVPALGVHLSQQSGTVHYILIQVDPNVQHTGPIVQFSEINFGGGSRVGPDWKDGARHAVLAAAAVAGQDPRGWTVTIKNRSFNSITDGMSASGAIAVGLLAAWRGATLRPDVALTGTIAEDGRVLPVGGLPEKLAGAAQAHITTVLVPRGQARTAEWDLFELAARRQLTVMEVGTLEEAYDVMTGSGS